MPELIASPSRVEAAGTPPKLIDEFAGRVNTGEERLSIARFTPEGAEYVAVCLPAFAPGSVHRESEV
ncbi:MAG TPA: hypothetical protein VM266_04090 [Solirubrobacteraceae bacterium]|nr:hypothetical protein [Solirubrobacteraceae bacterium]